MFLWIFSPLEPVFIKIQVDIIPIYTVIFLIALGSEFHCYRPLGYT